MTWYRAGTVTVANGSTTVTGAGTAFVTNVLPGHGFQIGDMRVYEVAEVISNTELRLSTPWAGGNANGQGYQIIPTSGPVIALYNSTRDLLGTFGAVRDGVGQGLFLDGALAAPGIRFANDPDTGFFRPASNTLGFATGGSERARIDSAGNLFVGNVSGNEHRLFKNVAPDQGSAILHVSSGAFVASFYGVSGGQGSSANTALRIAVDALTNRSLNAGGTINASGADYAEYMVKGDGCGSIAAGEICGVDTDGNLTRTWADARSWVVKSTSPAYVGGDSWATHLPLRPEQGDDEDEVAFAARLAPWEAQLETARQRVDRIAFSGQVPCDVTGEFAVGDYIIAAANGGGIKAVAIPEANITFDQYRRRIGKVWAIRDGRAWIDVQHG